MTWRSENSSPHRDSNSDQSVVQPVASRYNDCTIPAHSLYLNCILITIFLNRIYFTCKKLYVLSYAATEYASNFQMRSPNTSAWELLVWVHMHVACDPIKQTISGHLVSKTVTSQNLTVAWVPTVAGYSHRYFIENGGSLNYRCQYLREQDNFKHSLHKAQKKRRMHNKEACLSICHHVSSPKLLDYSKDFDYISRANLILISIVQHNPYFTWSSNRISFFSETAQCRKNLYKT
jgi:hypothetical protein